MNTFPKFCKPAFPRVPCFSFARSVSISFFGDANPKECDVDGNAIGSKVIRFGARSESFAMVMSSSFRAFFVCAGNSVGNGLLDVRHMFIELRLAAVQIFVIVVESLKSLKRLSSKRRRRRLWLSLFLFYAIACLNCFIFVNFSFVHK